MRFWEETKRLPPEPIAVLTLSTDGRTDESSFIAITRNSNTFTLEGITCTLNAMAGGTGQEAVTVNVAFDLDQAIEKITAFVNDYNTLLGTITDKLNEEYNRDYQPLTEDEKESLTDTEIEQLTEKAKEGLLRNDIYLTTIASSLRSSLYTSVSTLSDAAQNIKYILADIGITTSSYKNSGKLDR